MVGVIGGWWCAGLGVGGGSRRFGVWKWAQRRLAFQVFMLPGHAGVAIIHALFELAVLLQDAPQLAPLLLELRPHSRC